MSRFDSDLPRHSRPDADGITTIPLLPNRRIMSASSIMRRALGRWPESKNFSAEAKASAANPKDLIKHRRDSRTEALSLITEIRERLDVLTFQLLCRGYKLKARPSPSHSSQTNGETSTHGRTIRPTINAQSRARATFLCKLNPAHQVQTKSPVLAIFQQKPQYADRLNSRRSLNCEAVKN
jgi:hypothetical protein